MSDGSPIEWLNIPGTKPATWNPLRARHKTSGKTGWHCEHVHEGCTNCYAERQNKAGARGGTQLPYKPGHRKDIDIYLDEKTLLAPLHWKAPRTIFVCSMTDLYGNWVSDEWLDKIKAVQALTPQHIYIELTKRPERMREYNTIRQKPCVASAQIAVHMIDLLELAKVPALPVPVTDDNQTWPLPLKNVWGLVSCSTQEDADAFIPILLNTPLAIRGVSAEPLLSQIDFHPTWLPCPACGGRGYYLPSFAANHFVRCEPCVEWAHKGGMTILPGQQATPGPRLDWVIIGGESGKNARPMHPDWPRAVIEQCHAAGVPCFFKQWGEWLPKTNKDGWRLGKDHIVFEGGESKLYRGWPPGGGANAPPYFLERVGKKVAGRFLDGAEHNGFPQARGT